MTELHPTNGHQIMREPFPKTRRITGNAESLSQKSGLEFRLQAARRVNRLKAELQTSSDSTPLLNRSIHRNWERLAIWSFVAVSFAAFFLAGYVIWAKCHGR